jgi:hypothetical protein
MPYAHDGLSGAVANVFTSKRSIAPVSSPLFMRMRLALAAKQAATASKPNIFTRRIVPTTIPVLKMPAITPNIAPPVVDYMPRPDTPTIVSQGLPYPAAGGGQVTSGSPSPILQSPAPTAGGDLVLDDSTPSQAGFGSPLVMLLLAGLAVGFLLKKKR